MRWTRREFLWLAGSSVLASALVGCSSGSSSSGGGDNASRTAVTGDLRAQVNLFSQVIENLSGTWLGASNALDALRNYQGRAARGPADVRIPMQGLSIGLNATRVVYERLTNAALMLDDGNAIAETVSDGNALTRSSNLENPQWVAGMVYQNYAAIRIVGALFRMQQLAGLQELRVWTLAATDPQERLTRYAFAADVFNAWVDTIAGVIGITADATWKLDVSVTVAADTVAAQLNRLDTIIPKLPLSPGYRPAGVTLAQSDDASLGGTGILNFARSLTGVLAQITLTDGTLTEAFLQNINPANAQYNVSARLGQTGIGQTLAGLAGGLAKSQEILTGLLSSTESAKWPGLSGESAQCQIQLIGKMFGFLHAMSVSMITSQSTFGTIITGNQAVQHLDAMKTVIAQCASVFQKREWDAYDQELTVLRDSNFYNGAVPAVRNIPIVRITPSVETDQFLQNVLPINCDSRVRIPTQNGTSGVGGADVCAIDPKQGEVAECRRTISGLPGITACPRTFRNVELCLASLLANLSGRYADTVPSEWLEDGTLRFCAGNFARLLRREPGAEFAEIPAITEAALLCAGVGYIPTRSLTPMNLATLPAMPDLAEITNLVGGAPINVK